MKNVKKLVLLAVFSICSVFFLGIGKVKAVNNPSIVCTPASVDYGEKTKCVLYANFLDDSNSYYAMLLRISLTDLVYQESAQKSISVGSGWGSTVLLEAFNNTGESNVFTHLTTSKGKVSCTNKIDDGGKESCALLYSASESAPGIKNKPVDGKQTVIAEFNLKLKEKQEVKTCGKICIIGTYYKDNNGTETSFTGGKKCTEVEVAGENKPEKPVPTGNFTSYVILAAGAFIAICAVLVAKKNNRFYRV